MRIDIITLFPDMFAPLNESILRRAQDESLIECHLHDLRNWGIGNYRQVDDQPYGGGAGMILRADVVVPAIEAVIDEGKKTTKAEPHRIYLSARGDVLNQQKVEHIAQNQQWLILLCGHYEGIDQRIVEGGWIDEEVSIGKYVLTGGELPAMVLVDAVSRYVPGVLGGDESLHEESYTKALDGKKEYPHYTRPEEFAGLKVPYVLLSGHHAEIEQWRRDQCC